MPLAWTADDRGEWTAPSAKRDSDGDESYEFRIQVCHDGTFDWSRSDIKLLPACNRVIPTESSLASAKQCCQVQEDYLVDRQEREGGNALD